MQCRAAPLVSPLTDCIAPPITYIPRKSLAAMCILLVSTAHPKYPLILLSNRDEFLHRPTASAAFWDSPHAEIFSGRDLARPERGTWLGITRTGRLAVLTNFRESSSAAAALSEKSRGAIVTSFLASPEPSTTSTKDWIHHLLSDGEMKGVGGFSLLCGTLRPAQKGEGANLEKLAVICNRTAKGEDGVEECAHWIAGTKGETHGLSNSLFDYPWPKVTLGKQLLSKAIKEAEESEEEALLEKLFGVLSHDTLPVTKGKHTYETDLDALRYSIFIPAFDASAENCEPQPCGADAAAAPDGKGFACGIPTQLKASDQDQNVVHYCTTPVSGDGEEIDKERLRSSPRLYGTQKQTVVLVDGAGRVKYVERTLYDEQVRPVSRGSGDVVCEFDIEGWQ